MAEGEVLDADSNPYGGLYIIISGLVRVRLLSISHECLHFFNKFES